MILEFQITSDDEEWYEGFEFDNNDVGIGKAVKIQDPISSLELDRPLIVESGTNIEKALNLLQQKEQNCNLL